MFFFLFLCQYLAAFLNDVILSNKYVACQSLAQNHHQQWGSVAIVTRLEKHESSRDFFYLSFYYVSWTWSRLLPNKMPVLPGLSLTTDPALDALAAAPMVKLRVVHIQHYSSWASAWPTTVKPRLQNMDHAHTLHTTKQFPKTTSSTFSFHKMCLYLISPCVDH